MGYVSDMRRRIGHDPLIFVGASVLLADSKGRLLLQRRADNGLWGYHGGAAELYEEVSAAARRELKEETGLTAGNMTLFGVYSGPRTAYTYPNGDRASIVDVVYLCTDYTGTPHPQQGEVSELRWFGPEELPEDITPTCRPALEEYARRAAVNETHPRG